jgi:hypothetical protein
MANFLADDVLRERGIHALEAQLGPLEALRFLALVSREPFDYQRWRDQRFGGLSVAEILAQAKPPA